MRVQRKVQQLSFGAGAPSDKITPVMDFLKENYQIEVNRYDPNQIRIRSLKKNYRFPVSLDDISIHMMLMGIQHTRSMVQMILRSPNQMKTYDPITEYFDRVGKMDVTESHIDKLIAHLRVRGCFFMTCSAVSPIFGKEECVQETHQGCLACSIPAAAAKSKTAFGRVYFSASAGNRQTQPRTLGCAVAFLWRTPPS